MGRRNGFCAIPGSSCAVGWWCRAFWISAVELVNEFLAVAEFRWFPAAVEDLFYVPVFVFVGVWVFRYDFFGLTDGSGVSWCWLE